MFPVWRIKIDQRHISPAVRPGHTIRHNVVRADVGPLHWWLPVTHPIAPQSLFADIYGAAAPAKRINHHVKRLRKRIKQVVNDADVRVAEVLGFVCVLGKVPDIKQWRLPVWLAVLGVKI